MLTKSANGTYNLTMKRNARADTAVRPYAEDLYRKACRYM